MKDSSLIIFTLSSQTAAGMTAWLAILTATHNRLPLSEALILGYILALAAVALLTSLAHLGQPRNAIHAIRNWRTSWLSREIGLAVAFTALIAILFLGSWLTFSDWKTAGVPAGAIWIAALLAIGLVLVQANVYRLRTAPGWGNRLTGPTFLLTGWLLGGVSLAIMTILEANRLNISIVYPWFPLAPGLLVGLGLQVLVALAGLPGRNLSTDQVPGILRLLCLLSAVFALFFWQILLAAGLILLGEILGRLAFYAERSRVGV